MKKLLLLALIPLIGINRMQASLKDFCDKITSYYLSCSNNQQVAMTAGFMFAHGLGYFLGKKIRSIYDVRNKQVVMIIDKKVNNSSIERTSNAIQTKRQLRMLKNFLNNLELAENDIDEENQVYLESQGWSWNFDKDLNCFIASQKNNPKHYYCEIKNNKLGWALRNYKTDDELKKIKQEKLEQRALYALRSKVRQQDEEKQLNEGLALYNSSRSFKREELKEKQKKPVFNLSNYYGWQFKPRQTAVVIPSVFELPD
ncbi:hypothetical protein Noda2021_00280 [Candidatus Dependentiae bacterium Noda2021]|nr:hypothetical protein Noda2021_00280 [Candidatus Dependentiae bacterium Noda2021]